MEDKVSGQALESAEAKLATAQHQTTQLQSQLRQEQTRAGNVTHLESQAMQLRRQLQQQVLANEEQATAVAAMSGGFDQERASWQEERNSLLSRAKVSTDSMYACTIFGLNKQEGCRNLWFNKQLDALKQCKT